MTEAAAPPESKAPIKSISILVGALLFGASTLYNTIEPASPVVPPSDQWWTGLLAAVSTMLTIGIRGTDTAELRCALLPAAVGVAALLLVRRRPSQRAPAAFEAVGLLAGGAALLSAYSNNAMNGGSLGWIGWYAAGFLWAIMIGRFIPAARVIDVLLVVTAVALVVCGLAFWHRAATGLQYFNWPIGPITPTAGVAAMLAASAAGGLVAAVIPRPAHASGRAAAASAAPADRSDDARSRRLLILLTLIAVAASLIVSIAQRRAAMMGAVGGVAIAVLGVLTARRLPSWVWGAFMLAAVCGIGGATAWVRAQLNSSQRDVSGPVAFRLAYWRESMKAVAERPLLGHGPDRFAAVITPRLALQRAEQPQVFHGNIDPAAHQEWLQAAVEFGVPGAVCYLAVPLLAMFAAWRRLSAPGLPRSAFICGGALLGGVSAVLVGECASVSLRGHTLPAWYWTWIGLLLAVAGGATPTPTPHASVPDSLTRGGLRSALLARVAIVLLGLPALQLYGASVHANLKHSLRERGASSPDARALPALRLGFGPWIAARQDLAMAMLDSATGRTQRSTEEKSQACAAACDQWGGLAREFPGMFDHEIRLAESLIACGRTEDARAPIEQRLARCDPYDVAANLAAAQLFDRAPLAKLERLVHALRAGGMLPELQQIARDVLRDEAARAKLTDEISSAIAGINRGQNDTSWAATLTPEWLRLAAWYQFAGGDQQGAILQGLACEAYDRLERNNSPLRRAHDAEWDAWLLLARMVYQGDHASASDPPMLDMVLKAESAALLGSPHERLRQSRAQSDSAELLGSALLPTVTPPNQRPLWWFSTMIHMAAGRNDRLMLRAMLCLPAAKRTPAAAEQILANVARQLVDDFAAVPEHRRPVKFGEILRLAAQAGPAASQP